MKKSRIIILIILAMVLIVTSIVGGYRYSVIAKAKTGYLVYADKSIIVINLETTTKTKYNVDGYSELRCIGEYYGGDFCCIATNNVTETYEILLFKNGVIEKTYSFLYDYASIAAHDDKVYYLTYDSNNKGDLVCISGDESIIIENDVEDFSLNSLGEIVYIKEIPDDNYSAEDSINGELYYYVNGKNRKLGDAYRVQWVSDKELLVGTEKVYKEYDSNGELISAAHSPEDYTVIIENNKWTYSKEFNKIPSVACFSPDGKKSVVYYTDEGFTTLFFGIYDIEKDICDKKAIYDGINNEDVFDDMGANVLWLDKNPMD